MIGDVLTSSIMFEALHQKFPNAQLDYLINEHTLPVVKNNPFIDNFVLFTRRDQKNIISLFKFTLKIRRQKYDIVVDVYSKLSSNIISLLSGAETKISYFKPYSAFFYSNNIKRDKESSSTNLALRHRLQLLEPLDIQISSVIPKIYLSNEEISESSKLLLENGLNLDNPLYMISVLGSGKNKTYPLNYMAEVIDTIISEKPKAQILFNYIPAQESDAKNIYNLCKPETQNRIFLHVFGNSLRQFLAITYHCNALIGNEGGAVNMAKALNVKTFSIFSPWIDKSSWNLFENESNIGVHLKDYEPNIYTKAEKHYKQESETLYLKFKPNFFKNKLIKFLNS